MCYCAHIPVPANPQSMADLASYVRAGLGAGFMEGVSVFLFNLKFVQFKVFSLGCCIQLIDFPMPWGGGGGAMMLERTISPSPQV